MPGALWTKKITVTPVLDKATELAANQADEVARQEEISKRRTLKVPSNLKSIFLFAVFASLLSLAPIILPFGDPYDVTTSGYVSNVTYFIGYSGIGWGFLWAVHVGWFLHFRIVLQQIAALINWRCLEADENADIYRVIHGKRRGCESSRVDLFGFLWTMAKILFRLNARAAVVLPTAFAVILFFVMYIVLGGPFPLGTLLLGAPCFVFSWWALWRFEGKTNWRAGDWGSAAVKIYRRENKCSNKKLASVSVESIQDGKTIPVCELQQKLIQEELTKALIPFFALTVFNLILYFCAQCLATFYPNADEFLAIVFVFCEEILSVFDVHASMRGIIKKLEDKEQGQDIGKDKNTSWSKLSREEREVLLADKKLELITLSVLFKTFFYTGLHLTYMNFLFPVVAGELKPVLVCVFITVLKNAMRDAHALTLNEDVRDLLENMNETAKRSKAKADEERLQESIESAATALAAGFFTQILQFFLKVMAPVTFMVILVFNHFSYNTGMFFVLSELSDDMFRVVVRNVGLNLLASVVSIAVYLFLLQRWDRRAAGRKRHTSAETKVLKSALGKLRTQISKVCLHAGDSGLFFLLLFTQAAITTIVGVCMLMKHDGMDAKGVMEWAFGGKPFPWKLEPVWDQP